MISYQGRQVTALCEIASLRIHGLLETYFKRGEQEKESIIRVRVGLKHPSLGITVCHHSASLVMTNGDPLDRCFYPTHTLMIDSYILTPC